MSWLKYYGAVVMAAACLAALGCSSGDSGDSVRIAALERQLEEAADQRDEALQQTRDAEAAQRAADARAAREAETRRQAEADEREAEARATREQQARQQAQTQAAEAEARAAEVERKREASQRAQFLQAEFPTGTIALGLAGITMDVPSRGRLELMRGSSWRSATIGGAGLRSTTMPLGSTVDTGKTVVYTDRELSRPLLEHFGSLRDSNNLNVLTLPAADLTFTTVNADGESTDGKAPGATTMDMWDLTHGIPKTVARDLKVDAQGQPDLDSEGNRQYEVNAERESARMAESYPLSLFGIGGSLVCAGGCDVVLTPAFVVDPDNPAQSVLQTVAASSTTAGNLRFDPSGSPSVHFYNGSDFQGDIEYMVFGYWREDPSSPISPYDDGTIGVFADAINSGTNSQNLPERVVATYRGAAVGMYVEQEQSDPIDTHRQGEFVATAILRVNGANAEITGTIRDFVPTPTGGSAAPESAERWVLSLGHDGTNKTITLNNQSGGTTEGDWTHDYVQAHKYAGRGALDGTPPGVTGTFNARIGTISRTDEHEDRIDMDALHIIGAFGAHR